VSGVRGRRLTAFLTTGLLALVAAGCGGDDSAAPEVPGPPADVVIPESADAPTSAAEDQGEETTDDTGDATTDDTTTDDTGGTTTPEETAPPSDTGAVPETSEGGTAAPEAETDGPSNDTPPPEGSNAEQFEDFCAQNPGAC
jgi:hypothetical protein